MSWRSAEEVTSCDHLDLGRDVLPNVDLDAGTGRFFCGFQQLGGDLFSYIGFATVGADVGRDAFED